jgi:peptidoglycan biosynthesis protein MviN/MurJ (putative lipid II flippase)
LGVGSLLLGLIFAQIFIVSLSGLLLMLNGLRPKWQGFRVLTRIPFAIQAFTAISVTSLFALLHAFIEKFTMLSMMSGLVASYLYGISIVNVLISVLTFPFINFIWPKFVDFINRNEEDQIFSHACNSMRPVIIILIALASFIGYFSLETVNLLFKRGEFTNQSAMVTAEMLSILLFAAVPVCIAAIFSKVLFAQKHFIIVIFSGVFSSLSGIFIILTAKAIDSIILIQWNWVISNFLGLIVISSKLLIQQGNLYKTFSYILGYALRVCIIVSTSLFLTPPLPNDLPNKQAEFSALLFSFFVYILIFTFLAILLKVINLDYRTRKYA